MVPLISQLFRPQTLESSLTLLFPSHAMCKHWQVMLPLPPKCISFQTLVTTILATTKPLNPSSGLFQWPPNQSPCFCSCSLTQVYSQHNSQYYPLKIWELLPSRNSHKRTWARNFIVCNREKLETTCQGLKKFWSWVYVCMHTQRHTHTYICMFSSGILRFAGWFVFFSYIQSFIGNFHQYKEWDKDTTFFQMTDNCLKPIYWLIHFFSTDQVLPLLYTTFLLLLF